MGTLVKLTQCIHLHKKNKAHYLRIYIIRWPVLYVLSNGFFKVGYRLPVVTLAHEEAANINFQASSSRSNRVDNLLNGYCTLIAVSKWQEEHRGQCIMLKTTRQNSTLTGFCHIVSKYHMHSPVPAVHQQLQRYFHRISPEVNQVLSLEHLLLYQLVHWSCGQKTKQ